MKHQDFIDPETGKAHQPKLWLDMVTVGVTDNKGQRRYIAMSKKDRMDQDSFTLKAIVALRNDPYKGIHSVYSGFNAAFKEYFDGQNPVDHTVNMVERGLIVTRPVKGGVMIYLPDDAPQDNRTAATIEAITGQK